MSTTRLPDRYERAYQDGRCVWCWAPDATKTYTVATTVTEDGTDNVYAARCFKRRFCSDKCRDLFFTEP